MLRLISALALICAAGTASCTIEESAPEFPEGQGQQPETGPDYAPGPYGIDVGATIANFTFTGFRNPSNAAYTAETGFQEIQLADFYNPTGDGVFEVDSDYALAKGATEAIPKPKALWIIMSAVWCAPCNEEARTILPGEYLHFNPLGVEFFTNLADGPQSGVPAEQKHLISWTTKYDSFWPSVIDPNYKLSSLFEADAFPANLIIDTKTMKIREVVAGVPPEGSKFFDELDALTSE
jgi:hypothetical protein